MFLPSHFTEQDTAATVEMVRASGFGHLTVVGTNGLSSTPIPILIDDEASLVRGHLALRNPVVDAAPTEALLIVPLADGYISPGWYRSKQEHGKVVPTWNYEVVHLHGRLETHDAAWTLELVRELTDHHEAAMPQPWSVDDAPATYIEGMLRAIVGVSLTVTRVEAKRKLSQNRPPADVDGAIEGLRAEGVHDVADSMERHKPKAW